ncbi:MAG: hypothetical protein WAL56_23605 [Candidatus Sulfotelmatobacter sp.]
MAFEFVPTRASEKQRLIEFLVKSFHADATSNSFRPEVIHWKYFAEHPEWRGPRSFAVMQQDQMVAHGGVWPLTFVTPEVEVKAIHLNDWTASRTAVGAGVFLLKKVTELIDVHLAIGGSQDTRKVLPKLGYQRRGELRTYARVIRPWLQFRTTPGKNWKSPLRFLRNSAQAAIRISVAPKGWQASKVSHFPESIENASIGHTPSFRSPRRTAAGLNYMLSCPAARFSGFLVSQQQRLRGYFLLTQVGRQARIVDMRMDTEEKESWQAICALAAECAADDPETCEITAATSIEKIGKAWLQTGFTQRKTEPIFCYDPRNLLSFGTPLDLNAADCDFCILSDPAFPYLLM